MGQKKPEDDDPQFQFADDEFADETWFHRAKDAGVRYVRTFSEKSGLKVLPQMSLDEGEKDPSTYVPGQPQQQPPQQPQQQPPPPSVQPRLPMQTNAARMMTARQRADAEAREKGRTVLRTILKLALIATIAGVVGHKIYGTVNNAKMTDALRKLDHKKKSK